MRSGSVFNFFRPSYVPPNTAIASAGLVAPEFQITEEVSVAGYINFMQTVVNNNLADLKTDYKEWLPLANNPAALVAEINLMIAAG